MKGDRYCRTTMNRWYIATTCCRRWKNFTLTKTPLDQFLRTTCRKQQANITEIGEKEATDELSRNFNELNADPADSANYPDIRQSIYQIQDLNEMAILRKNATAQKTADNAKMY